MVVMRGRRMENNLYRMERSIVTERSKIAAATQDQQDVYRLWYYRLGHIGDCGMRELSKSGMIFDLDCEFLEVCESC